VFWQQDPLDKLPPIPALAGTSGQGSRPRRPPQSAASMLLRSWRRRARVRRNSPQCRMGRSTPNTARAFASANARQLQRTETTDRVLTRARHTYRL